jgi:hypothetical protein
MGILDWRLAVWREGGAAVGQGAGREIAVEERGWTIVEVDGGWRNARSDTAIWRLGELPLLRSMANGGGGRHFGVMSGGWRS